MKIIGKIIPGKGKGRKLGFPTANIKLQNQIDSGVYSGIVAIAREKYLAAIFIHGHERLLEAHLLDFSGDLYGRKIEVELRKKIRDSMKFTNDNDLKKQIYNDVLFIKRLG